MALSVQLSSTGLEQTDIFRVLYSELCGDLCDHAEYENSLQATEALCANDCKSLADALLAAVAVASKTSEDKRLGIELSMMKQRPVPQRDTLPMGEGSDDACRCSHQGQKTKSRRVSAEAAAHCPISNSCHLRDVEGKTEARERKLLRHQESLSLFSYISGRV